MWRVLLGANRLDLALLGRESLHTLEGGYLNPAPEVCLQYSHLGQIACWLRAKIILWFVVDRPTDGLAFIIWDQAIMPLVSPDNSPHGSIS